MRILLAPDKFKGSLSGWEVARALEKGFRQVYPGMEASLLPIADGGDGTAETLGRALSERFEEVAAVDAMGRPCRVPIVRWQDTAAFDVAATAGLVQIEAARRDPWVLSTRGVGLVLRELETRGVARVLIGLGGSATNDAGVGMAAALGYQFLDPTGKAIPCTPLFFDAIETILLPAKPLGLSITALCDVTNPLLDLNGASHVYGPQKGLADPAALDAVMGRLAERLAGALGRDHRNLPRAGAAGGLGYGLAMFCGATLADGFETVSNVLDLEQAVKLSDLVLTGEGCIDRQTLSGKGPAGVARLARRHGKPVHAFCGILKSAAEHASLFDGVHPLVGRSVTLEDAFARPAELLAEKAAAVAQLLRHGHTLASAHAKDG